MGAFFYRCFFDAEFVSASIFLRLFGLHELET
jgi:hypothetical protein